MRLIHTSDWHLGQTLHGQERTYEHQCFLTWLLQQLHQHSPDALLIAGDIFDNPNPSVSAQQLLYDFILQAHQQSPQLQIVMIAGNHDSGARIELPAPLMQRLNTHALGRLQGHTPADLQRLIIPLQDAQGEIWAWCLAIPFLRPAEITGPTLGNQYLEAVQALHQQLLEQALKQRQTGQALIALTHAHLVGGVLSEDSERNLIIGNAEALPARLFPEELSYVALGHLHRPQQVAGQPRLSYSGSPIPLSFAETSYAHQVLLVHLEEAQLVDVQPLPIPRAVAMQRLGPAPLKQLLSQIQTLEPHQGPRETYPWLEVRVQLEEPRPDLRPTLEAALEGKNYRLIRIQPIYPSANTPSTEAPLPQLDQIAPDALFSRAWAERFGQPPSAEVMSDFAQLMQQISLTDETKP